MEIADAVWFLATQKRIRTFLGAEKKVIRQIFKNSGKLPYKFINIW